MQIFFLALVVAVSLVAPSIAVKNLAQNSQNEFVGNFPDLSQLPLRASIKLAVSLDANTDTNNWLQNTFYLGSGCSGSVIATVYLSTGFCIPTGSGEYISYSCNSAAITATTYSDASCTTVIKSSTTQPPIDYCFATDTDDDGYINADTGAWDSNMYTCSTGDPQNTLPAPSVSRTQFMGTGCSNSNMIAAQFKLQEYCYTSYDGTNYSSFIYSNPYSFVFTESNCNPVNLLETTYYPLDSCSDEGGDSMSYATYGTISGVSTDSSDDGVSTGNLAIGIVFSFIGGVIVTVAGAFVWFKYGKSAPLGSKADNANNL